MEKSVTTNNEELTNDVIQNPYLNKEIIINKKDAKQVIEDNNIDKLVGEMYNSLIYERSKNPSLYMVRNIKFLNDLI